MILDELKDLIRRHLDYTGSAVARRILNDWEVHLPRFVKVMPLDYKRVLLEQARQIEPCAVPVEELVEVDNG